MLKNLEYGSWNLSNSTLAWSGYDSLERWKAHNKKKHTREQLINLGYTDESITYKYNEYGFRTEPFHDKGNSIIFLGCSYTVGIGVRYEKTMPYIVSRKLNLDCINLGVHGGTNDTSFRLANYWIEKLKPSIVVFQPTEHSRFETYNGSSKDGYPVQCVVNHAPPNKCITDFYYYYLRFDENIKLNYDKNRLAIEAIANKNRIKFIQTHDVELLKGWPKDDLGRDLKHPGVQSHRAMAKRVINKINEESVKI